MEKTGSVEGKGKEAGRQAGQGRAPNWAPGVGGLRGGMTRAGGQRVSLRNFSYGRALVRHCIGRWAGVCMNLLRSRTLTGEASGRWAAFAGSAAVNWLHRADFLKKSESLFLFLVSKSCPATFLVPGDGTHALLNRLPLTSHSSLQCSSLRRSAGREAT